MKTLQTISTFLIALLLMTSCDTVEEVLDTPLSPNNSENKYDFYGQQHNEGLTYIFENHGDEIASLEASEPLKAEQFIFEKAMEYAKGDIAYYEKLRGLMELPEQELIASRDFLDLEKLLKTPPYNPYEEQQLQQIINEVLPMPHETTRELNAIITKIIALETKYQQDDRIENQEAFFAATSVLRYSAFFWGKDEETKKQARRPWWQIVVGDCVGAAVGTLLGGPATGVGLGVGISANLK